jgi:alkanesulfonate monooxygenase SsuD/methylene tetrahydromethanopterin reductase-like flavin-dependent oxidoreductase (luciferase family)
MPAPFPSLVAAAQVTTRPRLGTLVLNAGFYKPALLARDVASTDQLVNGRLEVGLGAGYAQKEYEAAELPFPSAGQRIDYLEHTVVELRRLLADDDHRPSGTQHPTPPLMIAGAAIGCYG